MGKLMIAYFVLATLPTLEEFQKLSLREAKALVFVNSFPVPSCQCTR